ncbi:MAG: ABC transporter permease [Lachnospirales bacterium]
MAKTKQAVSYKTAQAKKAKRDKYYKFISLIGFFILWELFGRINLNMLWIEPKFLPMPSEIIMAAYTYLVQGTLWEHLGISLYRVLVGYLWGVVIAVVLGSLIASIKAVDNVLSPIINLFGPIPIMAFLPMFILWFGIGESSKIVLIAYATIIYMISYVIEGIKNTDPVLIRSAISLGAKPMQLFFCVKFQSAFPNIFLGMKGALGTAFSAMVVAEMMGASTGLGYIIVFSKNWFKMSDMVMAAIVIGLMYSVIFGILTLVENILFKWKKDSTANAIES